MNRFERNFLKSRSVFGFALMEALIAFVVLAAGLLALLAFHNTSQKSNAEAKSQSEAVALANDKLQELESSLLESDGRLIEGTFSDPGALDGTSVTFEREWVVAEFGDNLYLATVNVSWIDRDEIEQTVTVSSYIEDIAPTDQVEGVLKVAAAAKLKQTADQGGNWNTGGEPPPGGEEGESGTGDGGNDEGEGGYEGEPIHTVYDLVIEGAVSGGQNVELDAAIIANASADPELIYPASCEVPTKTTFTCTLAYNNRSTGWGGTITLTINSNRVFCGPGGPNVSGIGTNVLTIGYTNLTQNVTTLNLIAANNANQC